MITLKFNFLKQQTYVILAGLLLSPFASAHPMVAQHGTLNIVDDGAFMVLSLAISSFEGIDDDRDGAISLFEFNSHRIDIMQAIKNEVRLQDRVGICPLEDIILSPLADHHGSTDSISQLTVMGRFALAAPEEPIQLHIGLYGLLTHEQAVEVSAKRGKVKETINLTPTSSSGKFFKPN